MEAAGRHSVARKGGNVTGQNGASRRYPDRPLLGVGAVVFNDGRILLIERGKEPLKGWWTVPGGLVEAGERLEAAVRRETLEETGLRVKPVAVAALFQRIMPDLDGRTEFHYVIVDYLCELESGTVRAASDVAKAGWFTAEESRQLKMAPGTQGVLDSALALVAQRKEA
jgi:ADP-ribose pyrophosphatase YjhB (NUDIX family)